MKTSTSTNNYAFTHSERTLEGTKGNIIGYFAMCFSQPTTLTKDLISKFTQEFYENVISKTTCTIQFSVCLTFKNYGALFRFTLPQYVNQSVHLSVLVEIIFCFWYNLQEWLPDHGKVTSIYIH